MTFYKALNLATAKDFFYSAQGDFFTSKDGAIEFSSLFTDDSYYKIIYTTEKILKVEKRKPTSPKLQYIGMEDWTDIKKIWNDIVKSVEKVKKQKAKQAGEEIKKAIQRIKEIVTGNNFYQFDQQKDYKVEAYDIICALLDESECFVAFEWKEWRSLGIPALQKLKIIKSKNIDLMEEVEVRVREAEASSPENILLLISNILQKYDLSFIPFSPAKDELQSFMVISSAHSNEMKVLLEKLDLYYL